MVRKLTEPQQRLLEEIRDSATGGLFIRAYSRWSRTVNVLHQRGLVTRRSEGGGWWWYEVADDQNERPTDEAWSPPY